MADEGSSAADAALDDLDARVTAAEHGDLGALSGWTVPAAALPPVAVHRARRILARQQALLARLLEERTRTAAALAAVRKPQRRPSITVPVYVDRTL